MNYCLGTVQFGLNYGIQGNGQPHEESAFEMLTYAIINGIEFLDTASAYGEAEKVLGVFFNKNPKMVQRIKVVSKLKPDAFSNNNTDEWSKIAVQNAKDSIDRLCVDKLFAYLFHNATYIFNEKAVEALYEVKRVGLSERIGVSIYTPEEAMKALEYPEIEVVQIPYNLFDHRLDKCGFFEKAKDMGVTVFARSSLLQGLVMMDPNNLPEKVSFAKNYLVQYQNLCKHFGLTSLHMAVGYVGNKYGIDYVVFGVDNLSQLKEYIEIKDNNLPTDIINFIDKSFIDVEEKLVNPVLWR